MASKKFPRIGQLFGQDGLRGYKRDLFSLKEIFDIKKELAKLTDNTSKMLSMKLVSTVYSIPDWEVGWQIIDNNSFRTKRQDNFIRTTVILAYNAAIHPPCRVNKFSWHGLPNELKLAVISFLYFAEMGKTEQQCRDCASFIFRNIDTLVALIRKGNPVKIIEYINKQGEERFCFFSGIANKNIQRITQEIQVDAPLSKRRKLTNA